jgi:hypothetical protein
MPTNALIPVDEPERADARFWIPFAAGAILFLIGGMSFIALHGIGGVPGTVTQNEQARPDQQTAASPTDPKKPLGNEGAGTSGTAINTDRKGTR